MKISNFLKQLPFIMHTLMFLANWQMIKKLISSNNFAKFMRYTSIAFVPLGFIMALLKNDPLVLLREPLKGLLAFTFIIIATSIFAFFNYKLWHNTPSILLTTTNINRKKLE